MAVVAGAAHADQVADDSAGHRRREPVVVAGQVARHEAAVAVAGDRQPLRVGESLGDELVDGLEEVVGVRDAPRAVHPVVELLAVAVAAARVDEQDRPAARGQLLVVEVDLVGRGVPGVVRAAVDVDQERQRSRALGVADQPRLHLGAVADGEGALDTLERLDVGESSTVLGQHGLGGRGHVDHRELAVRRGRAQGDHRQVAGDREPRHDPTCAVEHRPGVGAVGGHRPEVGAPALAHAEQDPTVGRLLRQPARVGRGARHHVAVQGAGEVDRDTGVERDAEQPGVTDRVPVPADDEQALAVDGVRDRAGDPVGEREHPGQRLRVVHGEQVDGDAEAQVAVLTHRAGEGDGAAVGRPRGCAGVLGAVGDLAALARGEVDHVHLAADRTEHPGAVGLVVEPVGDQRASAAGVDGSGEREPGAVRAPHRSSGAEREVGHPLGLASVGGQQVDLTVADERDPRPVRRPRRGWCRRCPWSVDAACRRTWGRSRAGRRCGPRQRPACAARTRPGRRRARAPAGTGPRGR